MDIVPVELKLRILAGQVDAAANIGMWCFDKDGRLFYTTCPYKDDFLGFLELSECKEQLFSRKGGWDKPVILSDSIGLNWIGEHLYKNGEPDLVILMGPMFLNSTSVKGIDNHLKERESSLFVRRKMMNVLQMVPVVMVPVMFQYGVMLHYSMTDEKILSSDFYYPVVNEGEEKVLGRLLENTSWKSEDSAERQNSTEQLILQGIREGRPELIERISKESEGAAVLVSDTGDGLRDGKNTVIVLNALCSRAAISGGLSIKTAKGLERKFIGEVENCKTFTELVNVNLSMLGEYIMKVQECRSNPHISREIREACEYIKANIRNEFTIEDLAKEVGYAPYYLTKKFSKEMNMKVSDYVKYARIEYAKIMLISTKKGIQEISDTLHFGTRNYFSKVFREIEGISPNEYREQIERGEKK